MSYEEPKKDCLPLQKSPINVIIYVKFLLSGLMNKTSIDNEIYDDPNIMLNSRVPRRSVKQKWTYLRSDYYVHRAGSTGADPFMLYLEEIRQIMGTTEDIQAQYIHSDSKLLCSLMWWYICLLPDWFVAEIKSTD
jgi:hypothetical protein